MNQIWEKSLSKETIEAAILDSKNFLTNEIILIIENIISEVQAVIELKIDIKKSFTPD
jgi:hypothetical protein